MDLSLSLSQNYKNTKKITKNCNKYVVLKLLFKKTSCLLIAGENFKFSGVLFV